MARYPRLLGLAAVIVCAVASTLAVGVAPAAADPGIEGEFVTLTNDARAGRGAGRLTVDAELTAVARRWSGRMAADNRLAHNPNLAREVTANWEKLGENVGTGDNAPQIHDAFMNSAAHRANILDGAFTHVGIGVQRSADGRIWVTEVFMRLRSTPPPTTAAPAPTVAPTPTTARPRTTTPPPTAPPTTAASPTTTTEAPTTTTSTTTTVPLPPPPPDGSSSGALPPRYVLVLDGLVRLDRGH